MTKDNTHLVYSPFSLQYFFNIPIRVVCFLLF